jgi:hypothetical protein
VGCWVRRVVAKTQRAQVDARIFLYPASFLFSRHTLLAIFVHAKCIISSRISIAICFTSISIMSRPRRPSTESTQLPPTKIGGLKGSMRKGFKSLRETLRKKDTVGPRSCTGLPHDPSPARKQEEQVCGASGVGTEREPEPIERSLPPPRMRIRNTKRSDIVFLPNEHISVDDISFNEPVRRFKIKGPTAVEQNSCREELRTPPPTNSHTFRSEQRHVESTVEINSILDTVKQQEQEDHSAKHTAAAGPEVEAQDKLERALLSADRKEGELLQHPLCNLLANGTLPLQTVPSLNSTIACRISKCACTPLKRR